MILVPLLNPKFATVPPRNRANFGFAALVEASGRVRQHGVDLAGLRGEIGPRHHLAAVVARDLFQQPLELADIAIHRLLELAVGAIALADLVERLLALHGVEPLGEHVALAAIVAVPQLGRGVVVHHAGDVDRERIERLDGVALGAVVRPGLPVVVARRGPVIVPQRRTFVGALAVVAARGIGLARRAAQQVGQPAAASGRAGAGPRAGSGTGSGAKA